MGTLTGPSLIRTLLGACGLRSLRVALSPCFRFGLAAPHTPVGAPGGQPGGEGDWSSCCRRIPQSAPEGLFLLEKFLLLNPAAPYKEGHVLSPSPPLWLDRGLSGSGPHMAQLSTLPSWHPQSPCVYHTSSFFPSLRLQATRSLSVLLKPCLAGEGTISLALSQESCDRPGGCGPGAAVALVPTLVPGTFLS